ncbi:MAG: hypothetical protein PHG03_02195 [Bacilli bacterium]|nr:hypothetical protein [Bacilli bacterium]MDD4795350.1 hypothetical protein [Bacilli bacterium]
MKIEINYDFMHKVDAVNGRYQLQRKMIDNKKIGVCGLGLSFGYNFLTGQIKDVSTLAIVSSFLLAYTVISHIDTVFDQEKDKLDALIKLRVLAVKLNDYIKTSSELLVDSEEYHRDYELCTDKGRIYLLQKKYIYIPTYNDGKIEYYKTSIVQEHDINIFPPLFNDKYILSYGTPKKVLKPSYA